MPPLVLLFLLHSSYIQYTQHCKPLTSPYLAFSPLLSLFNTQALSTTVVLFIVSLSSSGSTLIPCSNWGADQPVTVVVCIPLPSWDHGDGGNNEGYIWMELRVVHTSSFFLAFVCIHTAIPYTLCSHNANDCNIVRKWVKCLLILQVQPIIFTFTYMM